MRVVREHDVQRFLGLVGPHLRERPAENNLVLGLLGDLARAGGIPGRQTKPGNVDPVLLAVEGAHGIEGIALQTPPRALVVSRMPNDATEALVEFVLSAEVSIPGISGPDATAERFASRWEARTGRACVLRMRQTIHELMGVHPPAPVAGALREATADDDTTLGHWLQGFERETRIDPIGDHLDFVRGKRAARQLFLWGNDPPLSLAAWQGRTEQGVRVSYVYTPPAERKKGYASAVVAALSQRLLDEGNPRCFLFTNADNATSNKIYRSLGYEPVSDFRLFDFLRA